MAYGDLIAGTEWYYQVYFEDKRVVTWQAQVGLLSAAVSDMFGWEKHCFPVSEAKGR